MFVSQVYKNKVQFSEIVWVTRNSLAYIFIHGYINKYFIFLQCMESDRSFLFNNLFLGHLFALKSLQMWSH